MKQVFCSISVATPLIYGVERKAETGDFQALPNQPLGNGHKITDWEKFREFAKVHGDKTQVEMAQLWEEQISDSEALLRSADRTISRALKKIGFTRKKRLTAIGNGTRLNDRHL